MVSIIMPAYNAGAYLQDSVSGILSQTMGDFELIIVDDGSTDGSLKEPYADERVKIIHKENGGVSSARNRGLKEAKGEYILFVDADDTISPDFLETLLKSKADLVISDRRFSEERFYSKEELFSFDSHRVIWGVLYRREVIEGLSFREDLKIGEDTLFLAQAILKSDQIYGTSYEGYHYRENANGAYFSAFSEKKYDELKAQRAVLELIKNDEILLFHARGAYGRLCFDFLSKYYPKIDSVRRKEIIKDFKQNAFYAIKYKERDVSHMKICLLCPPLYFTLKHQIK